MKVLIVISTILSIALCELGLGGYNYEYTAGNINRSEQRNPDGSVTGQYNFVDEKGFVHDIEYSAGANLGFKILSHRVTENDKSYFINTNYTPEVQAAQDSHIAFQNYLRMVLPQISEDELPPVYIRHVPKPTKDVYVPIIPVSPPSGVFKRQVKNVQGISAQPQRIVVVNELPPSAQLGGRTLFYDRSPSHIEVKIQEVPLTIGDKVPAPKALQHNWFESTQQFEPAPRFVEHVQPQIVHHQAAQEHAQPQIVHHQPAQQHVQPQIVHHQPAQQHVQPQIVHHQPAQHVVHPQIVHHQPAQQHVQPENVHYQPTQQHVQEVSQFVQQRRPIAQDIELVNGFTPEVAKATAEHLSHVAAIKAVLPNIE